MAKGAKAEKKVKAGGGAEVLKESLRKARDPQVLGVGVEVLKKLV